MSDISDFQKRRKIARLPGARLTADTVLAGTLEKAKAGHVQQVLVVMQWKDGTVDCDWSEMPMSTATFLVAHAERWVRKLLDGKVGLV